MKKRIAVLILCALLICGMAQAATISVPTDQAAIQADIDYALSGDVIEVRSIV